LAGENERQGAAIKVSISSYVGTATLALIAGGVALYTYIQQNFKPNAAFYVFILVSVIALVLSFVFGGRGADSTAYQVAKGSWTKDTKTWEFNWQAILTLVGLIFLIGAALLGATGTHIAAKDPCVQFLATQLQQGHATSAQLLAELKACEAAGS
jgi:hypothetical protein